MRASLVTAITILVLSTAGYLGYTQRTGKDLVTVVSAIHELARSRARINEHVMLVRYGFAESLDPLIAARRQARVDLATLGRYAGYGEAGIAGFGARVAAVTRLFGDAERLVDAVVTEAVSFSAGRDTVGRLVGAVERAGCLEGAAGAPDAGIVRGLLAQLALARGETVATAIDGLPGLGAANRDPECRRLLADLAAQARVQLAAQQRLERDVAALTALPLGSRIERLQADARVLERVHAERTQWFSLLMFTLALLLGGVVYLLFRRLESSAAAVRDLNLHLEEKVREQTEDLRRANEDLRQDIEQRKCAEAERDAMEVQLRQAQKLEAVGMLAAGVAHEINTPIQYVGDNVRFLHEAFGNAMGCIERIADATAAPGDLPGAVRAAIEEGDVDYLKEETPRAIAQALDGIERVANIVRSMKDFAHPGTEQTAVDLNGAIESTITVARNEWKYVAEVVTELDPDLPLVPCVPGDINQVILNVVVNAAHAIADVVGKEGAGKGTITVTTRRAGDAAEIRINDTGTGIPEEVRGRIFDPFFTTKAVGKGTGQGLSIAHSVVVQKHGGTLTVDSEMGKGSTFTIRLPLAVTAADDDVGALAPAAPPP